MLTDISNLDNESFTEHTSVFIDSRERFYDFETIELNRQIDADNHICSTFMPFHGTSLRKMSEDLGYIKPGTITKSLYSEKSMLNMPQFTPDEIEGIRKCFVLYIKFPKNRWKEIERAEKEDEEGNRIYKILKEEFLEKYMPKPNASPHGGLEDFVFHAKSNKDISKSTHQDEMV